MPEMPGANVDLGEAYATGRMEGYKEGFAAALREIREALYKLYGNSMKMTKEKNND